MSNKERRKQNKLDRAGSVHINPAARAANKEIDGMPVHCLRKDERRYWSAVNRYGITRNEDLYYLSLTKEVA